MNTDQRANALAPLREQCQNLAKSFGSMLLFPPDAALRCITFGDSLGLSLAGIDSFLITEEGAIQPIQDFSNDIADTDLSLPEFIKETNRLIVNAKDRGLHFEIVFQEGVL